MDVALLCETWLRVETKNAISIPRYSFESLERKGGGVGILIEEHRKYRRVDVSSCELSTFETIAIELKCDKQNILLASCYRSPNSSATQFVNEFVTLMELLLEHKCNIIIGMDHNMDLLKCAEHKHTQQFFETILDKGLIPCITRPTRVTHSMAMLIDNIFCSVRMYNDSENKIVTDDISDNFPCLSVFRSILPTKMDPSVQFSRKLSEKNVKLIKERLSTSDWNKIISAEKKDPFGLLHDHIMTILDEVAPEKPKKLLSKKLHEPWITKRILRSITKQNKIYQDTIMTNGKRVTMQSVNKYKSYPTTLQKIKRQAKLEHYQNQYVMKCGNTKKLWQLINSIIKKMPNKHDIIEQLSIDNLCIVDSNQIAKELDQHFATIGRKYARRIPNSDHEESFFLNKIKKNQKTIFLYPTNKSEIRRLIKNLPNKTSSGFDDISYILLKRILPEVIDPLKIVFNHSLECGYFPDIMKKSHVVLIHKGGSSVKNPLKDNV